MQTWLNKLWHRFYLINWLLWPISQIYLAIIIFRRWYLIRFCQKQPGVPVIVVGNLTTGGVGKTPLVIALVNACQKKGIRVGVVSRGYKSSVRGYPYHVKPHDLAKFVGDEPLLIAQKTNCPVVISPRRMAAVNDLIYHHQCELIISDDGLQHYAMGRAIEIVVIDGTRGFGNNLCLPAGPMREPATRLQKSDFIIINQNGTWNDNNRINHIFAPVCLANTAAHHVQSYTMKLAVAGIWQLKTGDIIAQNKLPQPIAAVAAMGNPARFFATLTALKLTFSPYRFPDHHYYRINELVFKEKYIIMTEKDAVKCQPFASVDWYVLGVEAQLDALFWQALWSHKQLQPLILKGSLDATC